MPFCGNCGAFESLLKPQDLCGDCFNQLKSGDLPRQTAQRKRKKIESNINFPTLSYLHDLFPNQKFTNIQAQVLLNRLDTQFPQPNYNYDRNYRNNAQTNTYKQNQNPRNIQTRTNNVQPYQNEQVRPQNRRGFPPLGGPRQRYPPQAFIKSNIAILLIVIGLFMPVWLSIPLNIIALVLAIIAKRNEPPSWRPIIAIFGGIFLLMINIFYIIFYDDLLAFLQAMEEEAALAE